MSEKLPRLNVYPGTTLTLDFTTTITIQYGDDKDELVRRLLERVEKRLREFVDCYEYRENAGGEEEGARTTSLGG